MIFVILGIIALGYALWIQNDANYTTMSVVEASRKRVVKPKPHNGVLKYNPYLGDQQLVEMKDRIFSSDITENNIHSKPSSRINGIYGITENAIKLNPSDAPLIISGPKAKLNI